VECYSPQKRMSSSHLPQQWMNLEDVTGNKPDTERKVSPDPMYVQTLKPKYT
jgi:hypothetical protein